MGETIVAGLPIPSTSPAFLAGVGLHVAFGLAAVITGAVAMLSRKGPGRHRRFGTIYFWAVTGLFLTATVLAIVRWEEDRHLFVLGLIAFAAAALARSAHRRMWRNWPRVHLAGMGVSYIAMLTAFYVDNGKNLPVWRTLPHLAFWIGPSVIGLPLIAFVMMSHPLTRPGAAPAP